MDVSRSFCLFTIPMGEVPSGPSRTVPFQRLDHLRISSLTGSTSTDSVTSVSKTLTPRNPPENFCFFRVDCRGVVSRLSDSIHDTDHKPSDWVVYRLGSMMGSVGHRVKIHKTRPPILDFTMTHDRFGRSLLHPTGNLTHTCVLERAFLLVHFLFIGTGKARAKENTYNLVSV